MTTNNAYKTVLDPNQKSEKIRVTTALALVYIVAMSLAGSYFLAKSATLMLLKNNVTLQNKN